MTTEGLWREKTYFTFRIPSLPPSVNAIYQINFTQRKVLLKPEVRIWKTTAKQWMPPLALKDATMFRLDATFNFNWLFQNGKIRKFDTPNLLKILIDAVAERYGIADELVKWGSWSSVHDGLNEYVDVRLAQLEEVPSGTLHPA